MGLPKRAAPPPSPPTTIPATSTSATTTLSTPSETTTANRKGPSREHFSSVDISRSILENPRAAALHKKSIDNGGKGFTSHWITVKADEGADGVDGLTLANTFTRKWALMTDAEKKRRGLEWVVDLLVQLPDGCTVPRYFDADATPPRSEHYGINEDLASSPKPQTHFAVFYCGVAPEFDMSVEAQEAHGGMFDLSCESGATDALLVPKFKHDKKHGMSMSIWYAPVNGYNVGVGKQGPGNLLDGQLLLAQHWVSLHVFWTRLHKFARQDGEAVDRRSAGAPPNTGRRHGRCRPIPARHRPCQLAATVRRGALHLLPSWGSRQPEPVAEVGGAVGHDCIARRRRR